MLVRQVELLSEKQERDVFWVQADKDLKPGYRVRLDNKLEWWKVLNVYETVKDSTQINHDWHVGGITETTREAKP